jgi:hypothetical protein
MKIAIVLVKNIVYPQLEKDPKFSEQKVDSMFWEKFTDDLLHFDEDAKPIYACIYSLELADAEKIIAKLPIVYSQLLKELAESYILGEPSKATEYLVKTNNDAFLKEVHFLQTMQQAIKSIERKRIKADLPNSYKRLTFELSETDVANATKKKGREDLKEKMKQWDAELVEEGETVPIYSMLTDENKNKKETKVVSLSWMKYAVAASIIIATGILYFKNSNSTIVPTENSVVTTQDEKENVIQHYNSTEPQKHIPTNESIVLAAIETTSGTATILQSEALGFTSNKKVIVTINFKDATKRMLSLEKLLEQNKTNQTIDSKILGQYKSELTNLKIQKDKYVFDGKTLTLFSKKGTTDYEVMQREEQVYYLKKGDEYYILKLSNTPLALEKVTNATTIETLEKIHFENQ